MTEIECAIKKQVREIGLPKASGDSHAKVISSWSNTHSQRSGPSVERIIEKAVLTVLPKLDGLTPPDMVLFYDNLQKISSVYLFPLMLFDAINLCLGFEGLCPPGLSVHCYADICRALMEVLPRLLPCSISRVTTAVSTTLAENGNEFALLWDILALSVPGFDPTLQILAPIWEDFLDILNFCHAFLLYFRLQAKLGLFHDDCKKSCTFLWPIQHTEYLDVVTILQTHVEIYMDSMSEYDNGYLPSHLCLVGLAERIDKNWQSCICDVLPCMRCMQGFGASYDTNPLLSYYVQGYAPQVFHTGISGRGHNPRGFQARFDGDRDRDSRHDNCPP